MSANSLPSDVHFQRTCRKSRTRTGRRACRYRQVAHKLNINYKINKVPTCTEDRDIENLKDCV